jgi:hypothetical protein
MLKQYLTASASNIFPEEFRVLEQSSEGFCVVFCYSVVLFSLPTRLVRSFTAQDARL